MSNKIKRTLIYKRTHNGDPDSKTGVFGNKDCMGRVRGWLFDAVIGVGGTGYEPQHNGIAEKLTWIGIGPRKFGGTKPSKCKGTKPHKCKRAKPLKCDETKPRGPLVAFDHFLYRGEKGPLLKKLAPNLARRMYDGNVRYVMDSLSDKERSEVEKILNTAREAPPSGQLKIGGNYGQPQIKTGNIIKNDLP